MMGSDEMDEDRTNRLLHVLFDLPDPEGSRMRFSHLDGGTRSMMRVMGVALSSDDAAVVFDRLRRECRIVATITFDTSRPCR